MPKPIYIPDGRDPTEEEYPIPGTGLATFGLAIFAVVGIVMAFIGGVAVARPKTTPTFTPSPSATSTATQTIGPTAALRHFVITFTPSITYTPSTTPTGTLPASATSTSTPTRTPSNTPRPTRTPRPVVKSQSEGGSQVGQQNQISIAVATIPDSVTSQTFDFGPPIGPFTMVPIQQPGVPLPQSPSGTPTPTSTP